VASTPKSALVLTTTPPTLRAKIKLKAFFPPVIGVLTLTRTDREIRVVHVEAIKQNVVPGGFAVVRKRFALRRGENYR
jgi:hypothetical protein